MAKAQDDGRWRRRRLGQVLGVTAATAAFDQLVPVKWLKPVAEALAAENGVCSAGEGPPDCPTSTSSSQTGGGSSASGSSSTGMGGSGAGGNGMGGNGMGGNGGGSSGMTVSCTPNNAQFGSGSPGQVLVSFDLTAKTCTVTNVLTSDELVIDDYGGGEYGGSGSNFSVVDSSHGTVQNGSGFYIIDGLPANTPITLTLKKLDTMETVTITFTIVPGTPGSVTEVTVTFG